MGRFEIGSINLQRKQVSNMIVFILSMKVSPSERKEVVSIFDTIAGSTSVKPGCKKVRLYSDVDNDDELLLIEEWETVPDLERHIASDEFRKIMAIMDLAIAPPDIAFNTVSSVEGFELVEKIRARMSA
jgi:quinol monooxygenase YgiN